MSYTAQKVVNRASHIPARKYKVHLLMHLVDLQQLKILLQNFLKLTYSVIKFKAQKYTGYQDIHTKFCRSLEQV